MPNLPYKNPISPIQLQGTQTLGRSFTFGTNFSVLSTGGFMEVYNLSDLVFSIPSGQTGIIESSGNTIPIQFSKGINSTFSPDVLTLNSDNISSGRRRLGMLVYVRETDNVYQYNIKDYDNLWSAATASTGPGGSTVIISDFGTTVKNNTVAGQNFINAWTASTIEGVDLVSREDVNWKIFYAPETAITGGSFSSGTLTLVNASGSTVSITGFTGSSSTISGDFLPLSGGTVTGATIFQSGLTANTISATTYFNLPNTLYTGNGSLSGNRLVDIDSFTLNFSGSGATDNLFLSGGSVGIGTITPAYKLDVNGIINTNNAVNISTNGSKTGIYGSSNALNFWAGNSLLSTYRLNGNISGSYFEHTAGFNNTSATTGTQNVWRLAGSVVPVGSNSANTTQLLIDPQYNQLSLGSGVLRGIYYNPLVSNLNTSSHIGLEITSGEVILNSATGNTGIGLSSPTNKLHVSATTDPFRVQGLTANTSDTNVLSIDTSGVVHTYSISNLTGGTSSVTLYTGDGTLQSNRVVNLSSYTLNFSSATNPDTLFLSGGSVGIGKSPSYKLDVNGDINFPSTTGSTYGVLRQNGNRILHTYGTNNLFLGINSGNFTTTGSRNIAIGNLSSTGITFGDDNVSIGVSSHTVSTTGIRNISIGTSSLRSNTNGGSNISIGVESLSANTTGIANVAIGDTAMRDNISGGQNVSIGLAALRSNTTSSFNVAIGSHAMFSNLTGSSNVAIGQDALRSGGQTSVAVGRDAGRINTGTGNVFIGNEAGYNSSGNNKLIISNSQFSNLIYGEFDNGKVGINTIPNNALTVSASTDPLQLINVQTSNDTELLTIDGSGVVHKTASSGFTYFLRNQTDPLINNIVRVNESIFNPSNLTVLTGTTFIVDTDADYYVLGDLYNSGTTIINGTLKVGGVIYNVGTITGPGILE